jgi:tetratricopeptide (TPR) repeat protein
MVSSTVTQTAVLGLMALFLAVGSIPTAVAAPPAGDPPRASGSDVAVSETTLRRGAAYFHLMRAQQALRDGRVLEVLRQIREATALDPDSAALHAQAATLLLQLGQRSEGQRLANRALELDPDNRVAIQVLAELAASRVTGPGSNGGSLDEAIRLYERLTEFPEVDDEVLLVLAQLKLRAGEHDGAITAAARLAAQRPGDPLPIRVLVQTLIADGQLGRAQQTLLDFVLRNPSAEDLLFMAEQLAHRTGDWIELADACARIIEQRPDLASVRGVRGRALLALDAPHGAVADLERAVALDPDDPSVAVDLARAYQLSKRLADAGALAESVAGDYPGTIRPLLILGEVREEQGDFASAIDAYGAALEALRTTPSADPVQRDRPRLRIVSLLAAQDRLSEALSVLDDLEVRDDPDAMRVTARVALEAGDLKRARNLARKIRALDPADAALIEAEAFLAEDRLPSALARFREAIDEIGPSARRWAARALQEAGRAEEEEAILREWVRADPESPAARYALGSFLDREARYDESETEFRRAMELRSGFAEVMNYLGYSLADRNERLPEALSLIQQALETDPWNGAYLDSLGWVYYRMGRFQEAQEPLERAAREFPNDPIVLEHLGDLYRRLEDLTAAKEAWRAALAAGPADPDGLREKLEAMDTASPGGEQRPTPR